MRQNTRRAVQLAVATAAFAAATAYGQTPEDRRAASDAYDRGSVAYLNQEWGEAARWFEVAHRRAPVAAALIQAVRAHRHGGNLERAGTLALRLERLYPDDVTARETAAETIAHASTELLRIDVVCDRCTVQVGGVLLEHPSIFVRPGDEHRVVAEFSSGERSEIVSGRAGETRRLEFEAPEAGALTGRNPTAAGAESVASSEGLSPLFFFVGAGMTAIAAGVLVWSGVDTLAGVDDYERIRSMALLEEGQSKELRTNILIGVTTTLAIATTVLLFFTSWSGGDEHSTALSAPSLSLSADGWLLELGGTLQ